MRAPNRRRRAWDDTDFRSGEYTGPVPKKLLAPSFAPHLRALCACRGCSPFVLDDGIRTRTVVVQEESAAFVGQPHRRRTVVTKLVEAETYKEAVMAKRACGNCGESGHNARSCDKPKRAKSVAVSQNGGDPILRSIEARIAEYRDKIEALEKAKAALAE